MSSSTSATAHDPDPRQHLLSCAVRLDDLRDADVAASPLPEPAEGQLLLRIDGYALTANNATYAELGERLDYWRFFPAPPGRGCIPAWGHGEVLASRHPAFAVGERLYGFVPMASHLLLQPARVEAGSFVDDRPHRRGLPAAYNLYRRCAADPGWHREDEALQALLQPVFITSVLLDDWLDEEGVFGARQVVIASASSKVALGLAFLLRRRGGVRVVGISAAANRGFVQDSGCYDQVLSYDALEGLDTALPAVFVDMAGHAATRERVHRLLGDALRFSSAVGMSHRDAQPDAPPAGLPGPAPVFFFAPQRLRKRAADWGRAGLERRLDADLPAFRDLMRQRLQVAWSRGAGEAASALRRLMSGGLPPAEGRMASLWSALPA